MTHGYCEQEDVRQALQEKQLDAAGEGPLDPDIVDAAIQGVSTWLFRNSGHHWYDSGGGTTLIDSGPESGTTTEDVPSSPHRQHRQVFTGTRSGHIRYPQTTVGPFAKVPLPFHHVQEVTQLDVRAPDGDVTDWVASSDFSQGRDSDYYVEIDGTNHYGKTYLYVNARSIGARTTFDNLVRVSVDYGLDAASDDWQDVRRGVALLAASQLVVDDDLVTQIPDDGQLVNLETERDGYINDAVTSAVGLLRPYIGSHR